MGYAIIPIINTIDCKLLWLTDINHVTLRQRYRRFDRSTVTDQRWQVTGSLSDPEPFMLDIEGNTLKFFTKEKGGCTNEKK
jgi:hypothetical protein